MTELIATAEATWKSARNLKIHLGAHGDLMTIIDAIQVYGRLTDSAQRLGAALDACARRLETHLTHLTGRADLAAIPGMQPQRELAAAGDLMARTVQDRLDSALKRLCAPVRHLTDDATLKDLRLLDGTPATPGRAWAYSLADDTGDLEERLLDGIGDPVTVDPGLIYEDRTVLSCLEATLCHFGLALAPLHQVVVDNHRSLKSAIDRTSYRALGREISRSYSDLRAAVAATGRAQRRVCNSTQVMRGLAKAL